MKLSLSSLVRRLFILTMTCLSLLALASCDEEEIRTVYHYEITDVQSSLNLRANIGTNSKVLKQLKPGEKVKKLDEKSASDGKWIQIATADGTKGWVKSKYVGYKTERIVIKLTQAQKMAKAQQPLASSCFSFFDMLREYAGQFDILFYTILTAILGWGLGIWIFFSLKIRWWHYILMTAFVAAELIAFVVCDPFAQGVKTNVFILDLIFGLSFLALPVVQWYCTIALLNNLLAIDDDDDANFVKFHLILSLGCLIPVGICFWLFESVADYSIIFYLIVQGICLIYAAFQSVRYGRPFAFVLYLICFVLFFVPFLAFSITMALMFVSLVATILLFLSPLFSSSTSSKASSYTLTDRYGRHVDDITSGGTSIHSGARYRENIDRTWRKE